MFDHQLARTETLKLLKEKNFKISSSNDYFFGFGILLVFCGMILIPINFFIGAKNNVALVVGIIVLIIGASLSIYWGIQINKEKKYNMSILQNFNEELHKTYFIAGNSKNNKFSFAFDGLIQSDHFNNFALSFHKDQKIIKWHVSEDIEIRTSTSFNSKGGSTTTTYKVYILKYRLENWLPNLNGLEKLTIKDGKAEGNSKFFQSESIEFNKRYQVTYQNQLQLYNFFKPKMIDDLIQQEKNFLKKHKLVLENGLISIDYRSNIEKRHSNCPDFIDWSQISWLLPKKSMKQIIDKIELDFNRFFNVQNLLLPFDLENENMNFVTQEN